MIPGPSVIAHFVPIFVFLQCLTVRGDVIVNAPQTVTHQVTIQPIRVRTVLGAVATTLGTATQEAYIKGQIDRVWAQAGVDIAWLPFVDYTNDFAYDGSPGNFNLTDRPADQLFTILNLAGAPPKSSEATVINLFFVNIVPGFDNVGSNTANGIAVLDGNGGTVHVGSQLLLDQGGRDVVASVIAHEIGHNLGLEHVGSNDNLMSGGSGTSERLTAAQKTIIFTDDGGIDGYDFLRPAATNYSRWAAANGVTGAAAADDDRDGLSNIFEFMFNLNPRAFSSLPQPVLSAAGLTWTLPKNQAAVDDGIVYRVEVGTALQSWLAAGTSGSGSTILQDDANALVVRLAPGARRRFMRLKVPVPAG